MKINNFYFCNKKNPKPIDLEKIGRIQHVCNDTSQTCTQDSLSDKNGKYSPASSRYSPESAKKISRDYVKKNGLDDVIKLQQPEQFMSNQTIQYPISQKILTPKLNKKHQKDHISFKINKNINTNNNHNSTLPNKQDGPFQLRHLIKQKLIQQADKKTLQKSESMMFMRMMVDNQSYSNLFSLLDNEEMDKMFNTNSSDQDQFQEEKIVIKYKKAQGDKG